MAYRDLPSEIKVRWSYTGEIFCRIEKYVNLVASRPNGVSSSASTSPTLNGSNGFNATALSKPSDPALVLTDARARIAAARRWSSQHNSQNEAALMQLSTDQTERRSIVDKDEARERREIFALHVRETASVKALTELSSLEKERRKGIELEAQDFAAFAANKEPIWRRMAQNKADIRKFTSSSLGRVRALYEDAFDELTDTLAALSFQEREDRDSALALQFQREEEAAAERDEKQRRAVLAAQQEQDALLARQQQQQYYQQQRQPPPSNMYGVSAPYNSYASSGANGAYPQGGNPSPYGYGSRPY